MKFVLTVLLLAAFGRTLIPAAKPQPQPMQELSTVRTVIHHYRHHKQHHRAHTAARKSRPEVNRNRPPVSIHE